jgi:hypothetical protein
LNLQHPRTWPLTSYDVVYEVVREVPAGLLTLAHEGNKAYSATFDLVHRREAERPNAIWQADHTLLDILVQREGESPAQPWLAVIQDDYSRAVAGYFLSRLHQPSKRRLLGISGCVMVGGVGKTLSARRCSRWDYFDNVNPYTMPDEALSAFIGVRTIFYTTPVVNTPKQKILPSRLTTISSDCALNYSF